MSLSFRVVGVDDVAAVVALVHSAFRGDASRAGWTTEADLLDGQRTDAATVAAMVDDPGGEVLFAEHDGEVVACCRLELPVDGAGYLSMVAVSPRRQAQGIGRALLAEAERRAIDAGASRLRMTVIRQRVELIAWYERLGYRATGETEPFPYGDERFGLPRVDDLEFAVLEKSLT